MRRAFLLCLAASTLLFISTGTAAAAGPTTTSISTSQPVVFSGNTVQLTTTVSSGSGIPAGDVKFYWQCQYTCGVGYVEIGTATLVNGSVTITSPAFTSYGGNQSTYSIKAVYLGNATYLPSPSYSPDLRI